MYKEAHQEAFMVCSIWCIIPLPLALDVSNHCKSGRQISKGASLQHVSLISIGEWHSLNPSKATAVMVPCRAGLYCTWMMGSLSPANVCTSVMIPEMKKIVPITARRVVKTTSGE
jgi:hypothetical protein